MSRLPAGSVARTANVCEPAFKPVYVRGEAQAVKAPPSNAHAQVEPESCAVKVKTALVSGVVTTGPDSIVVWGAVVSGGGSPVQV